MTAVPVLMYHSVTADPAAATRALSVHPSAFAEQLAVLRDGGYTGLTFGDLGELLRTGSPLPARPVVVTLDDGYADAHEEALPLLAEYGFAATVFVTPGWLRDAAGFAAGRPLARALSWSQVRELADAGVEIGAHSQSHPQLDQLPDETLHAELGISKAVLEDRLGRAVTAMAYPFGYHRSRVRQAVAAAGYRHAAAVGNAATRPADDPLARPRLTVRRTTTTATFTRIVACTDLARIYAVDRFATGGWSCVRRARRLLSAARGHG